jgi:transglutaminase-like putative cysteine protease
MLREPGSWTSKDTNSRHSAGLVRFSFLPLLFLALILASSGCIHAARSDPGIPARPPSGTGSPDNFLQQNVVNTSIGGPNSTGSPENSADDIRAAAIRDAIDSRNPVTRDFAVSLIPPEHGGKYRLSQICDLWETVYSRWTYVNDPQGSDYFSPASRTVTLGLKGDCDDFAIVVAAMIESIGGNARVVYARNGTTGHAYPEVYIGTTKEEFDSAAAYIRQRYHVTDVGCHITHGPEGTRYWLNLDWWSTHPGGRFFADDGVRTAYYPDGRWEQVES